MPLHEQIFLVLRQILSHLVSDLSLAHDSLSQLVALLPKAEDFCACHTSYWFFLLCFAFVIDALGRLLDYAVSIEVVNLFVVSSLRVFVFIVLIYLLDDARLPVAFVLLVSNVAVGGRVLAYQFQVVAQQVQIKKEQGARDENGHAAQNYESFPLEFANCCVDFCV